MRTFFLIPINDAQCGFKAMNTASFKKLVTEIENNNWFFDSELILLALKRGMNVAQIDVRWVDDPGSRVNVAKTAYEDIRGMLRIKKKFLTEYFS